MPAREGGRKRKSRIRVFRCGRFANFLGPKKKNSRFPITISAAPECKILRVPENAERKSPRWWCRADGAAKCETRASRKPCAGDGRKSRACMSAIIRPANCEILAKSWKKENAEYVDVARRSFILRGKGAEATVQSGPYVLQLIFGRKRRHVDPRSSDLSVPKN